jgi:DNA-binding NarL/FixJ family response regulator
VGNPHRQYSRPNRGGVRVPCRATPTGIEGHQFPPRRALSTIPVEPEALFEGRYRILRLLGLGGMSRVYLAEDTHLRIQVVLKENLQTTPEARAQFEREVQVLRLLGAGFSRDEIASELVLAVSTVRSYIKSLYSKLDAHTRVEAMEKARQEHLLKARNS